MLRHIELIDEEASLYGIKIVKSVDKLIAKKYGFRQLPGISYFRKGKRNRTSQKITFKWELQRKNYTLKWTMTDFYTTYHYHYWCSYNLYKSRLWTYPPSSTSAKVFKWRNIKLNEFLSRKIHKLWWRNWWWRRTAGLAHQSWQHAIDRQDRECKSENVPKNKTNFRLRCCIFL